MNAPGLRPFGGASVPAIAAVGLTWLASFAILYTAGDAVGAWPRLPPGAFRDVDLWVGMAAALALLAHLLLRHPAEN